MIYYTYNPLTFELAESHDTDTAPPNSTTLTPPAVPSGSRAMWTGSAWQVVADHRGETWYDQTTGRAQVITTLGTPAAMLTSSMLPAAALAATQADRSQILYASYINAITQPVAYMGTMFQTDSISQDNLTKTLTGFASAGSAPIGFYWVDSTNNQVPMTLVQLSGLAQVMLGQGWSAFQHLQTLKAQVRAATDIATAQAIIW